MIKEDNIYNNKYDYDDMKIAIVVQEFLQRFGQFMDGYSDYEDFIKLATEIRNNWETDAKNNNLGRNEFAYIQEYASKYLYEKFKPNTKYYALADFKVGDVAFGTALGEIQDLKIFDEFGNLVKEIR